MQQREFVYPLARYLLFALRLSESEMRNFGSRGRSGEFHRVDLHVSRQVRGVDHRFGGRRLSGAGCAVPQ